MPAAVNGGAAAPLTESYWPATAEMALEPTTCGGILRAAAAAWPDAIALIEAVILGDHVLLAFCQLGVRADDDVEVVIP